MIAVIAGTGYLPIEACKNLQQRNKDFFVVTLFPEDNAHQLQALVGNKHEIITQSFYRPSQVLDHLKQRGASHVLFIGKVDKSNLLKHLKFDWLAIKLLSSLVVRSDKNIMEALLAELARHNIAAMHQDDVLEGLLIKPGILAGALTQELDHDIRIGLDAARVIAHADIGQTVVVKNGIILAVEAIEGTDQCIRRGITLGKDRVVICKTARTDQNTKFDLPTLGPASLAHFAPGEVAAIAWHASCTLIAQKELFVARAQELSITLMACE